jgi:hypothetical protein
MQYQITASTSLAEQRLRLLLTAPRMAEGQLGTLLPPPPLLLVTLPLMPKPGMQLSGVQVLAIPLQVTTPQD